jgi:hypothetical protein
MGVLGAVACPPAAPQLASKKPVITKKDSPNKRFICALSFS